MTAGDVVAIVIWCLPSAIAIWHGARQKGHALEWGPRPNPRLCRGGQSAQDAARCLPPPKGSGVMPCCGATPFEKQGERLTADPALVNCDRQRLIAENARLQKEHDAYVQRLSADALQVASKYQRDLDEARAQIATLELLRRGEK